jgi:hypothetical protein
MAVNNPPWNIPPYKYTWVADSESPEGGDFAYNEQHATAVLDVDFDSNPKQITLPLVIADVLGFPVVGRPYSGEGNSNLGGVLSRKLPFQHPRFTWMWAQKIGSIQGRKFKAKRWSPVTATSYAEYSQVRLTVLFWTPPYDVWPDNVVGADFVNGIPGFEWLRFTSPPTGEAGIENIVRPGTFLRWANVGAGSPGFPPGTGYFPAVNGSTAIPSGIPLRVPKEYVKVVWHQVPAIGLRGKSGWGRPGNINSFLGRVNSAAFPPIYVGQDAVTGNPALVATPAAESYPAETLLFLKPTVEEETPPVAPELISPFLLKHVPRTYKVTFNMLFFDPPTDPRPGGGNTSYPLHVGHNGLPMPGSGAATGNGDYFYRVSTASNGVENVNGRPANRLYPLFDMRRLFRFTYPY